MLWVLNPFDGIEQTTVRNGEHIGHIRSSNHRTSAVIDRRYSFTNTLLDESRHFASIGGVSRSSLVAIVIAIGAFAFPLYSITAAEPAVMVSHIPREPVASAVLSTAGYSKRLRVMEIEFCNGAIYRYLDVPADVYHGFLSAGSKAQYYDWNIKGRYRAFRIRKAEYQVAR